MKGALAGIAGFAAVHILGSAAFAKGSQIVDPAIGNEAHVISDTPYVMSGDQSCFFPDVLLSSSYTMPVIGIGTYALEVDVAENSVYSALKCGCHLVDTARAYWNEEGVGRGIRRAIDEGFIKREQHSLSKQLAAIEHEISVRSTTFDDVLKNPSLAFDLIEECGGTYRKANDSIKKLMCQALFKRIHRIVWH